MNTMTVKICKSDYDLGLSLTGKFSMRNVVYDFLVEELTDIDLRTMLEQGIKEFTFSIGFEKFSKAKRVFFDAEHSKNTYRQYSIVSHTKTWSDYGSQEFICTPWLKKLLGRLPTGGEAIYYSLVPVKVAKAKKK